MWTFGGPKIGYDLKGDIIINFNGKCVSIIDKPMGLENIRR